MYKVDEMIRYREPLDADYSYGIIREIKPGRAVIEKVSYPPGLIVEIPFRYLEHWRRGGVKSGSGSCENGK